MTVPYDTALELAQLSGLVLGEPDLQAALSRVCDVSARIVPDCDGTSMTMRDRGVPSAVAADGEWAERLDAVQVEEQEGPCLDCMREGSVMRSRDLGADGRYPSYGPRAAGMGARSALSFPLTADAAVVGALNFYSREPDTYGPEHIAVGTLLAAHATLALQAANAYYSHRDLAGRLQEAMAARAVIEQAKGLLMASLGCDADAAFAHLVERSQHSNTKLRDLARSLVEQAARGSSRSGPV